MTAPLSYPDISTDKFSGIGPEDAEAFIDLIEQKVQFALGARPADGVEGAVALQAAWDNRQRALFVSLLKGPAAEWYQGVPNGTRNDWENLRAAFITRFTDGAIQYRYRIDAENCKRQSGEQIKSYVHRVTYAVQRGWPNFAQAQREQKYIELFVRGLNPIQLRQAAHKWLIQNPEATWQQLHTEIVQKDLSHTMSATLAAENQPQTSTSQQAELTSIRQEVSKLASMLEEQKINAVADPNSRYRSNATRFCKFCRRNGHSISFCDEKRAYDEEQRSRRRTPERKTFTSDYKRENSRDRYGNSSREYRPRSREYRPRYESNERSQNYMHNQANDQRRYRSTSRDYRDRRDRSNESRSRYSSYRNHQNTGRSTYQPRKFS